MNDHVGSAASERGLYDKLLSANDQFTDPQTEARAPYWRNRGVLFVICGTRNSKDLKSPILRFGLSMSCIFFVQCMI